MGSSYYNQMADACFLGHSFFWFVLSLKQKQASHLHQCSFDLVQQIFYLSMD